MEQSESIDQLATALAKAQGKLKNVVKSGTGNYGKYAELGPTLEVVRPILADHDLSIAQQPVILSDGKAGLTTQLMHKSGQWMRSTMELLVEKRTSQGQGSAITYARRYSLNAMLALGSDDDDGQAASESAPQKSRQDIQPKKVTTASREQIAEMLTAVRAATGLEERDDILKAFVKIIGYEPTKLSAAMVPKAIERIRKAGDAWAAKQREAAAESTSVAVTTADDLDLPIAKADDGPAPDYINKAQQASLLMTAKSITGIEDRTELQAFVEEAAGKPLAQVLKDEQDDVKTRMKHRWLARRAQDAAKGGEDMSI